MLLLPGSVRILLATEPVDMRNGIDGLAAIVQGAWHEDVVRVRRSPSLERLTIAA